MSEVSKPVEVLPESRKRGFEVSDAHVKPLAWLAVGLTLMAAGAMVLVLFLIPLMTSEINVARGPAHPMADYLDRPEAGGLLLQDEVTRSTDLIRYRRHQDEMANSYGWLEPTSGALRLPLDRAAELMLKAKAFPHRTQNEQ